MSAIDKRRKVSVQATAQGLLYYRTTLENLLRVIQTGDEKLIKRLIDDIRAGVPLEVISRTAAECLELTAVPPPPMLD
ncbi:hypothetical protein BDV28DRAFT_147299 [Aspergillus coremiiformis]|uniref:Uncharacterized protein n=1 Tax=Aspergillus coremiiformis TaxID=138285 RepID=A0A5N6ZC06_9EURO|nr:hypothetical protein BDV28DRAFT_147299 [Aspergillus coremiiformis]